MIMGKGNAKKINFITWFLPLYGIFAYYQLPIVGSVGSLILYAYTIVKIFRTFWGGKQYYCIKSYLLFTVYLFTSQWIVFAINGGLNSSRVINIFTVVMLFFSVTIGSQEIDIERFYKIYSLVAIISGIVMIAQFLQIYILGMTVSHIMLLPMDVPESWYSGGLRPVGFFPEPQAFATYVLPCFVLALYKEKYIVVAIIAVSILCSTSSLGILCALGILGYFLWRSHIKLSHKFIITVLAIASVAYAFLSGYFDFAIQKIMTTDYTNNVRLTRGWSVFMDLNPLQRIFGIGMNNLGYFIEHNKIILTDSITILMTHASYITTAYEVLVYFGVIGTCIYLIFAKDIFKYARYKILPILLVILSFGQTIIFNSAWVEYLIIAIALCEIPSNHRVIFKLNKS